MSIKCAANTNSQQILYLLRKGTLSGTSTVYLLKRHKPTVF